MPQIVNKPIEIKKILQSNLPQSISKPTIFFTNEKRLYISDKSGVPAEITEFVITTSIDCKSNSKKMPNKFYLAEDTGHLFYYNGTKMISITGQDLIINNIGDGAKIFKNKVRNEINFKTIKSGNNVNIIDGTDEIVISSNLTGEATTIIKYDNKDNFEYDTSKIKFSNNQAELINNTSNQYYLIKVKKTLNTDNWYQVNSIILKDSKENQEDIKWLFTNDNKTFYTRDNGEWISCDINDIGTKGMTSSELVYVFTNYQWDSQYKGFGLVCALRSNTDYKTSIKEVGLNVLMKQNDSNKIGSKNVDESNIENEAYLYYDGRNVAYTKFPFLPEWKSNTDYKVGMYFIHEDSIYQCYQNIDSSIESPDKDKKHFKPISVSSADGRNFEFNPIKLESETSGRLPEHRIDIVNLMSKKDYDTNNNGKVDKSESADKIFDIEKSDIFTYYGKDKKGNIGFHNFPIDLKQNNGIQQVAKDNVVKDVPIVIELLNNNINNKLIVQCLKQVEAQDQITQKLKSYINGSEDNYYFDKDNIDFDNNGIQIKTNVHFKYKYNGRDEKNDTKFIFKSEEIDLLKLKNVIKLDEF